MIEFKQIIGRGTRLFEGKDFFTILDFVNASEKFSDSEWDGEPYEVIKGKELKKIHLLEEQEPAEEPTEEQKEPKQMIKIKLSDNKVRSFQSNKTNFYYFHGRPITIDEFIIKLYGKLPDFFSSEDELREIWSHPKTREKLLKKLDEAGFDKNNLRKIFDEQCDLFDILNYIKFEAKRITRKRRVQFVGPSVFKLLSKKQADFINFVLSKYVESGVEELSENKLPKLVELKYGTTADATQILGLDTEQIREIFIGFQKYLYQESQKQVSESA